MAIWASVLLVVARNFYATSIVIMMEHQRSHAPQWNHQRKGGKNYKNCLFKILFTIRHLHHCFNFIIKPLQGIFRYELLCHPVVYVLTRGLHLQAFQGLGPHRVLV